MTKSSSTGVYQCLCRYWLATRFSEVLTNTCVPHYQSWWCPHSHSQRPVHRVCVNCRLLKTNGPGSRVTRHYTRGVTHVQHMTPVVHTFLDTIYVSVLSLVHHLTLRVVLSVCPEWSTESARALIAGFGWLAEDTLSLSLEPPRVLHTSWSCCSEVTTRWYPSLCCR